MDDSVHLEQWGLARPSQPVKKRLDSIGGYRDAGLSRERMAALSPAVRATLESFRHMTKTEERMMISTLRRAQAGQRQPAGWKMPRFAAVPSRNLCG